MIGKGVFTAVIEGKEVGFHFGTLAGCYTEEKSGVSIFHIFDAINAGKHSSRHLLNYFWGAAMAYNELNGIEEKPTPAEVSLWIDSMGLSRVMEIYVESVRGPKSKNGKAPATGQVTTDV
jgi:hypothetical protein